MLEEDATYVYRVEPTSEVGSVRLQPGAELFSFDDATQTRGRLRPRQHVGRIRVGTQWADVRGSFTLRVEPRKLDAETEYRRMLDDIASIATEAVLQGFAPASVALEHDAERRPELLYQQFAFLHARLLGSGNRDLSLVFHRPHRAWRDEEEHRPPGAPLRGGSRNLRALARSGARVSAPADYALPSLPQRITSIRTEETLDTEPNRFVMFALSRWRDLAQRVQRSLQSQAVHTGPVSRGLDAAEETIDALDRALSAPIFREVGRLRAFPSGNQVLQKRAGYRELLRTFVLTELGARLALDWDVEDIFSASQRNVATLYEYWAFLQLARSVGTVCGDDLSSQAFALSSDTLSMSFRQGRESELAWTTSVRGRTLAVSLYFNRQFAASAIGDSSWSQAMRPDCSVIVRPESSPDDVSSDDLSVWLHFDAKYRVEYASDQFTRAKGDGGAQAADAEVTERLARSKREDLLKMHAYRDAIRRSAGAFVLHPGSEHHVPFTEHHEVLPGLGAFALRPGDGAAAGAVELEAFLRLALDHVADRASQHERSRFWRTVIHRSPPQAVGIDRRLPKLNKPPADSPVLCGYVRGQPHRRWIISNSLYNLRAGNRRGGVSPDAEILRAPDLVLYGPDMPPTLWTRVGPWFVQPKEELLKLDYPSPRGEMYFCCLVERTDDAPAWLALVNPDELAPTDGLRFAPFATTWQRLLETRS